MSNDKKTIQVFCANEQSQTDHTLSITGVGEILLTCVCGRFLKLPKGTTPEELKNAIASHEEANKGQITVEALEAEEAKLIDALLG